MSDNEFFKKSSQCCYTLLKIIKSKNLILEILRDSLKIPTDLDPNDLSYAL
jgi:hypothetical protein